MLVRRRNSLSVDFGVDFRLLVSMLFDKEWGFLFTLCVMSSIVTTMKSAEPVGVVASSTRPAVLMLAHRRKKPMGAWRGEEGRFRRKKDDLNGRRKSVSSRSEGKLKEKLALWEMQEYAIRQVRQ